jgi:hypothetical protein
MHVYEDPEHWRDRADEIRVTAGYVSDPEAKKILFGIAEEYDKLVRLAEERQAKGRALP